MKQTYPALAGGFALSLLAQTAWAQAAAPAAMSAASAASAPSPEQADDAPQQVIVTANKREQRLQDVPVSVSVVDGAQLQRQNVNEVADLIRSAPALNSAGPFGALSIRGIGSISFSRSSEGSVGVVIDNVALGSTSINPPDLFDVRRVEVLEGPQGTLFGRNSSAGVLNIVTNAPDPTKFEAIGHLDVGTRNNDIGHAAVNVPLSADAALRVSGSYSVAPEQLHNLYDGSWEHNKDASGRARFLWQPTSDVTLNLIADYSQNSHDGGSPWAIYHSTPGSPLSAALAACGVIVGNDNDNGCVDGGNKSTVQSFGYSGQLDVNLGGYTLSSITAYRGVDNSVPAYDVDSTPVHLLNQTGPDNNHFISQELRLASPKRAWGDYVAGLYYYNNKLNSATTQFGPLATDEGVPYPLGQTLSTRATTTSYAAFADGTIFVTPELGLNLGARYGSEDVHAQTTGVLAPGAVAPIVSIAPVDGTARDTYFSYRTGLQYDVSDNQMAYVSYTRGYKGPAVNDEGGGGTAPLLVKPEIPHAAELGLKSTMFNGRLAANVALYYTKVDDFQAQFYDPSINAFVFGNAPSLTSKGIELNLLGKPTRSLTLNLGLAYNDAKYGSGYIVSCAQQQTVAQGCVPLTNAAGTVVGTGTDAGGNALVGSPKWKATFSGEYVAATFSHYQGFVQGDVVYTSRINFDAAYDPIDSNAAATIVGGRVGVRNDDGRYGVSLFVRNLFDTYRAATRFAAPTAAQQLDPAAYAQISGPESRRVVGVSLDARF